MIQHSFEMKYCEVLPTENPTPGGNSAPRACRGLLPYEYNVCTRNMITLTASREQRALARPAERAIEPARFNMI